MSGEETIAAVEEQPAGRHRVALGEIDGELVVTAVAVDRQGVGTRGALVPIDADEVAGYRAVVSAALRIVGGVAPGHVVDQVALVVEVPVEISAAQNIENDLHRAGVLHVKVEPVVVG